MLDPFPLYSRCSRNGAVEKPVMIKRKRVYAPATPDDGRRVLVDRVWPRGIRNDAADVEAWLKEAGPSDGLRKWFGHDPQRWTQFRRPIFASCQPDRKCWRRWFTQLARETSRLSTAPETSSTTRPS